MIVAMFEIEKFDGKGNFGLWKAKIKAILGQQKAHKAFLDPSTLPQTLIAQEQEDKELIAYRTLILNLSDSVLRQVIDQDTTHKIWTKLEGLFATKDLPYKMFLREKFFTLKMDSTRTLNENLDEFKKIVTEFKSLSEKLGDDNEAYVLLNSLPAAYKEVKNALKYGRESITSLAPRTRISLPESHLSTCF